ncbi:MAG: hypothetical protein ACPG4K_14830, partial [Haloferula sp.]
MAGVVGWVSVSAQSIGEGMAVVPVEKVKQKAPLFYSAEAETAVVAGADRAISSMSVKFKVHQGRAEKLILELMGEGNVEGVTGSELNSWSVRKESDGRRFLELFPKLPDPQPRPWQPEAGWNPWMGSSFGIEPLQAPVVPVIDGPREFDFVIKTAHEVESREPFSVLIPGPADAVGFTSTVRFQEEAGARVKVLEAKGLSLDEEPADGSAALYRGRGLESGLLRVEIVPSGLVGDAVELVNPRLVGVLSDDGKSISFVLRGRVEVREVDAAVKLLQGVAITEGLDGSNWRVKIARDGDQWVHELVGTELAP